MTTPHDPASGGIWPGRHEQAGPRPQAPWLAITAVAVAAVAAELLVSTRYGYVRDELYFMAAGQHLSFGYVDQPPLTPVLARLATAAGGSLPVLRLLPAAGLGVLVVLTAMMSRLLGAGRTGQVLAALAAATCGEYLATMHELTTTAPDLVSCSVTIWLVMRLLASRDPRWWLAVGGCAGVASEVKWNVGFLAVALAAGFLATPSRRLLYSRWLLLGALLAAAIAAPDVVWQAGHGWPAMQVFATLQTAAGHNRVTYWPAQVVYTGLALTPVWICGLTWSLRSPAARRFRPVAIACLVLLVLQFVLGGKAYYPGAVYTFLLAAGCVPLARWMAGKRPLRGRVSPAALMGAAMLAAAAVVLPVALPVLPARALHTVPLQKINYDLAESIGWPRLAALVVREYRDLPPAQRRHATILTGNYGEAGALDWYGHAAGLPTAYSGANNFWLWGPPPTADTAAIAVNLDPALLHREFRHVRLAATFRNGLGVQDDEQNVRIYVVTGLRAAWTSAWPAFRDYS